MTPFAYRSSQFRKFLHEHNQPHNIRNRVTKGSIQPDHLKLLSCRLLLCQLSKIFSWLIPYSETIPSCCITESIFDSCVMSLRGAVVFDLGMQMLSHPLTGCNVFGTHWSTTPLLWPIICTGSQ